MQFKVHKLVMELMVAINTEEWVKANVLVKELAEVLATYEEGC